MRGLKGKTAIVTGGGSGIGEGCCMRLAEEGVRVVVADINSAGAERVSAAINRAGGQSIGIAVNVTHEDDVERMVNETVRVFGQLDILLNNAAATGPDVIGRDHDLATAEVSVWDDTFAVNVRGVMLGSKHALRVMRPRGNGVVINMSSMQSVSSDMIRCAYGASKAAVNSITQHIATRYGREGIRCIGIAPGPVITPAMRDLHSDEVLAVFTRHLALNRAGIPEDIGATVAYLASDDAAFITGQTFLVDGGMTCHAPWFADAVNPLHNSN